MAMDESPLSTTDTAKGVRKLWEVEAHKKNILAVAFSSDGDQISAGVKQPSLKVYRQAAKQ